MKKAVEIILAIVILGTALDFGGVEPLAYTLMELGVFLGLLLLLISQTQAGRIRLALAPWPLGFILLVILQLVPLPSMIAERLSPAGVFDPGRIGKLVTLSIYPHDTLSALLRLLAYFGAFTMAAELFDSRKGRSVLVTSLILLGSIEAVYGIVQYVLGWHRVLTYVDESAPRQASGTYVNRNHYAALIEMTLPFVVGAMFYHLQDRPGALRRGVEALPEGPKHPVGAAWLFYLNLAVVMGIAVVTSLSRGGILSAGVGLLFMGLLARLRARRKVWLAGLLLLLTSIAGYGLWIGLGPALARLEETGMPGSVNLEGRVAFWKDTLRTMSDYPWTGTGLGTFETAFRRYQTSSLGLSVPHAHNDYLEFASDTGVVGAALLFFPIIGLLFQMLVSFVGDAVFYRRSILLGCMGGTLMLLIHSLVDFNLQIPANALIFSVVLGIGYKAACVERRVRKAAPVATNLRKEP